MELHMPHIVTHYLPELDEPERSFIERLTAGMSHQNIQQFAAAYRQTRKDPQTLRLMAVIGIVAVPGLHRFWIGHVGIGFLYLVTWALFFFATLMKLFSIETSHFVTTNKLLGGLRVISYVQNSRRIAR